jgi:hypothetical protein
MRCDWATGAGRTAVARSVRGSSGTALSMELDNNTIVGIAAGVGGLLVGIGAVAFTENQVRLALRSARSQLTRSCVKGYHRMIATARFFF